MPCYHPITGYQTKDGTIVFNQAGRHGETKTLQLPCGQCIGCRLERSRIWAIRCVHEASLYKRNCFITLTYNDENLPERNQLKYEDFATFMKRMRKKQQGIRFYLGAEYGTENDRPHFHAILFNWDFDDRTYFKQSPSGERIDVSADLQRMWTKGFSSVGQVTFESAAYIARYCIKKVTGEAAEEHYKRYDHLGEYQLTPEFNQMSRKPGIGADWYKFYKASVHTYDSVTINGKETNVPKYYDKLLKKQNPELMQEFKDAREWKGYQNRHDNTPERLLVKEKVTQAKTQQLIRGKI